MRAYEFNPDCECYWNNMGCVCFFDHPSRGNSYPPCYRFKIKDEYSPMIATLDGLTKSMHSEKCSPGEYALSASQLIDNILILCESRSAFCKTAFCETAKARCVKDYVKCAAAPDISTPHALHNLTPSRFLRDVNLWRQPLQAITRDNLAELLCEAMPF
jgi:hypothetical protein